MTDLLTRERLSELASITTDSRPPPPRLIVTLRWTIDARTGRPIGSWVLSEEPATPAL